MKTKLYYAKYFKIHGLTTFQYYLADSKAKN